MNPGDRPLLVVGLAKSGVAAARLAMARGCSVVCADRKPFEQLSPEARAFADAGATFALGDQPESLYLNAGLIVVSPGVPLALPELKAAKRAGVEVIGEVEFAWRHLAGAPRFIGITGTNGKSTTTALAGHLCERIGGRVFVGGNLGLPLSEAALAKEPFDTIVCELSSFQLEGIEALRPHVAVLTNVTPDHIDRYESHNEYGLAKRRIFMNQAAADAAIVNQRDPTTGRLADGTRGQRFDFGFGPPAPSAARWERGEITICLGGVVERLALRCKALRGEHNAENAMAALLAVRCAGLEGPLQEALDAFPGLAHRLESVGLIDGVEYVNDSKATNVDSTLVALKAFTRNVWLIAGGRGKGAPYTPMVEASRGRLKGLLTLGEDGPAIDAAYSGEPIVRVACGDLERAVHEVRRRAVPGDVALLSPACASYDQFSNFEERGEVFRRLVAALAGECR